MVEKAAFMSNAKDKFELRDEQLNAIYDFTVKVVKDFGTFIKSVVVFGSFVRGEIKQESDLDILIIVDDASVPLTPKVMALYQEELVKLLHQEEDEEKKKGVPIKIHANTSTITQFWDGVRRGDPLTIQILREGVMLFDVGFFSPFKMLLREGKIRPTQEAIDASISRALFHQNQYHRFLLSGANALYWQAVEAAHAALMKANSIPASPRTIPREMRENLLAKGVVTEEDIRTYEDAFNLMKEITHENVSEVEEARLAALRKRVTAFTEKMFKYSGTEV